MEKINDIEPMPNIDDVVYTNENVGNAALTGIAKKQKDQNAKSNINETKIEAKTNSSISTVDDNQYIAPRRPEQSLGKAEVSDNNSEPIRGNTKEIKNDKTVLSQRQANGVKVKSETLENSGVDTLINNMKGTTMKEDTQTNAENTKPIYMSKTIWFSVAIAVIGAIELNMQTLQGVLPDTAYGYLLIGISALSAGLRAITSTAVEFKK